MNPQQPSMFLGHGQKQGNMLVDLCLRFCHQPALDMSSQRTTKNSTQLNPNEPKRNPSYEPWAVCLALYRGCAPSSQIIWFMIYSGKGSMKINSKSIIYALICSYLLVLHFHNVLNVFRCDVRLNLIQSSLLISVEVTQIFYLSKNSH